MLFAVVETHHQGRRLSRDEIQAAAPVVGHLQISDWPAGNTFNRAVRVARLGHPTNSYHPQLLSPLFDPVLARMTRSGFLLIGLQIDLDAQNQPIEVSQGWWVRAAPENEV